MERLLNTIRHIINPEYLRFADLELRDNISQVKTIVISSPATSYRSAVNNLIFAKIKLEGKITFIAFRSAYYHSFLEFGLNPYYTKSDSEYFRIEISSFFNESLLSDTRFVALLNRVFIETFSFPSFGCCSRYNECSDALKCLHPDLMYATACSYRKNLENGKVFYGKKQKMSHGTLESNHDRLAFFDVETPNCRQDSICSIGIVYEDENGCIKDYYSLVNPECEFDPMNTRIHGISSSSVINAPTFPEIWDKINKVFSNCLIIGHNVRFDLSCIKKSLMAHGIEAQNPFFADTLDISRTLVQGTNNHKLNTLCNFFKIELVNHHNALEDAKATLDLYNKLADTYSFDLNDYIKQYDFSDIDNKSRKNGLNYCDNTKYLQELQGIVIGIMCDNALTDKEINALKYWMDTHQALKGNYPFDKVYSSLEAVLEDGIITEEERNTLSRVFQSIINPLESEPTVLIDKELKGKTVCLTGNFSTMDKKDFESFLLKHGAIIKNGVSKKLNYLIVGELGSKHWAQGNYGTKIKKAMELNESGGNIVIIKENDFLPIFEI